MKRIWLITTNGPVKVNLEKVKEIKFEKSFGHEEGWSFSGEAYWFDKDDDLFHFNYLDYGIDCDGPIERGGCLVWDGKKVDKNWAKRMGEWYRPVSAGTSKAVEYQMKKQQEWINSMQDVTPPDWQEHDSYIHDAYAEEMGY